MKGISEDHLAIGFVVVIALWFGVGLPFIYWPESPHHNDWHATNEPANTSNQEPRGTARSPFFVQVIPGPKPAEERAQEAEDRQEKKEADRWLVRWTAALFAATVGLILATGVLGYFAWRQMHDTRESIQAATRQAKAAEDSLTNLERPWIFVQISPKLRSRSSHFGKGDDAFDPPLVIFDIANHGRMPAVIDGCWAELGSIPIQWDDERNVIIPGGMLRDEFQGAIGPAERKSNLFLDCPAGIEYGVVIDIITEHSDPVPLPSRNETFVFSIEIHYCDVAGNRHQSGFCWRFDRGVNYWVQYGGPKYNYQT